MAISQFDIGGGVSAPNAMYQQNLQQMQGGGQTAPAGASPYMIGGNVPLPSQPAAPNVQFGQQPSTQWDALQKVLASPGDVASNPAYQFLQQQGQQALERTLGANQQRFSGGAMTEAQKFGQGLAGQYFGQLTNTLGNAANLELSRYLQPAQAQAGANVQAAQVAGQNWGNLANTLLGNYQTNVQSATSQNQGNYQAGLLNQAQQAQQGYQQLMPTVQNIAAQLQQPAPSYSATNIPTNPYGGAGAQYGYSPSNPSPAELSTQSGYQGAPSNPAINAQWAQANQAFNAPVAYQQSPY